MSQKACFFTGHRKISCDESLLVSYLREEILDQINGGATVFIAGGALGFDTLAAEQVIDMREDYDFIRLLLYLPCTDQDEDWNDDEKLRFEKIKAAADEIRYITPGEYKVGCMKKRNRAMVENADCGISYSVRKVSGTSQTIKMAQEKGIQVINIAEKWNIRK